MAVNAKHAVKKERLERLLVTRRSAVLWLSLVLLFAFIPSLLYCSVGFARVNALLSLAEEKATVLAVSASYLVPESVKTSSASSGAERVSTLFDTCFSSADCEAADSVSWSVYRVNGTVAEFIAGDASLIPTQSNILSARQDSVSVSREGYNCCAFAPAAADGKVIGIMCVCVDCSAGIEAISGYTFRCLLILAFFLGVFTVVFFLLAVFPAFNLRNRLEKELAPGLGAVLRRYRKSAAVVVLFALAVCLMGTFSLRASCSGAFKTEEQELAAANAVICSVGNGLGKENADCQFFASGQCTGDAEKDALTGNSVMVEDSEYYTAYVPVWSGDSVIGVLSFAQSREYECSALSLIFSSVASALICGICYIPLLSSYDRRRAGEAKLLTSLLQDGGSK